MYVLMNIIFFLRARVNEHVIVDVAVVENEIVLALSSSDRDPHVYRVARRSPSCPAGR